MFMDKDSIFCTILSLAPVLICGTIIFCNHKKADTNIMTDERKIAYLEKEISDLESCNEPDFYTKIQQTVIPINFSKARTDSRIKLNTLRDSLNCIKERIK